jgi:hypothetical protein
LSEQTPLFAKNVVKPESKHRANQERRFSPRGPFEQSKGTMEAQIHRIKLAVELLGVDALRETMGNE